MFWGQAKNKTVQKYYIVPSLSIKAKPASQFSSLYSEEIFDYKNKLQVALSSRRLKWSSLLEEKIKRKKEIKVLEMAAKGKTWMNLCSH